MNTNIVDVTDLFKAAGLFQSAPVLIEQTDGMYPHKLLNEDNWSYYTAVAFRRLREHNCPCGKVALVGIGSGVEGIIAERALHGTIKHLTVTDVDETVFGARRNIRKNLLDSTIRVDACVGSLCEPLIGDLFDLIFANIPNLPAVKDADLSTGAVKGTFLDPSLYDRYCPPKKFTDWALGAQYAYLKSARGVLTARGSVVTAIGGRVPLPLLSEMFDELGYQMEEVLVGFKEQTEAMMDFLGYNEFENNYGVGFDFYRYILALTAMGEFGKKNIVNEGVTGADFKKALSQYRVTAGQAIDLYCKGTTVGHTVHILRGKLKQ